MLVSSIYIPNYLLYASIDHVYPVDKDDLFEMMYRCSNMYKVLSTASRKLLKSST